MSASGRFFKSFKSVFALCGRNGGRGTEDGLEVGGSCRRRSDEAKAELECDK
jgi:hypothetical protein